jgi:hypothetical protein
MEKLLTALAAFAIAGAAVLAIYDWVHRPRLPRKRK